MLCDYKSIQHNHRISRYSMIEYLTKFKRIPAEATSSDAFSTYQLLRWSGEYLFSQIREGKGTICKFDKEFIVLYHTSCPRGQVLLHPHRQYWISFREAAPIYNIPYGYVMISLAPPSEPTKTLIHSAPISENTK